MIQKEASQVTVAVPALGGSKNTFASKFHGSAKSNFDADIPRAAEIPWQIAPLFVETSLRALRIAMSRE